MSDVLLNSDETAMVKSGKAQPPHPNGERLFLKMIGCTTAVIIALIGEAERGEDRRERMSMEWMRQMKAISDRNHDDYHTISIELQRARIARGELPTPPTDKGFMPVAPPIEKKKP